MTPLKLHILQLLQSDGPLNDLELWGKIGDQETGGLCAVIVIACLELQDEGYIEPPPNDPHIWTLSNQGLDYLAEQRIHADAEQKMLVEKYLLKELTGAELDKFEQHLLVCSTCWESVKSGIAFTSAILPENGSVQP